MFTVLNFKDFYERYPDTFLENYFGILLMDWQKKYIRMLSNNNGNKGLWKREYDCEWMGEKENMNNKLRNNPYYVTLENQLLYVSSINKYKDEIIDVNIIVPNKVAEVTFFDGDKQKSVCQEPDVYSLENAIGICLAKHVMGGSGTYNNAVRKGVKVYKDKLARIEVDRAEEERIAKKREKRLAYRQRREEKRKAAERAEKIAIQKEAYIQAMEYMNTMDDVKKVSGE